MDCKGGSHWKERMDDLRDLVRSRRHKDDEPIHDCATYLMNNRVAIMNLPLEVIRNEHSISNLDDDVWLWQSIRNNDTETLRKLLTKMNPGTLLSIRDVSGCAPLHIAARFNNLEAATLLMDYGCDCNESGENMVSPLYVAIMFQNEDIIRLFVDRGAKPEIDLGGYGNSLHVASTYGSPRVAKLLFSGKRIFPVNQKNSFGMTPLHEAAQAGNDAMASWLLENGAHPRATDARKVTPFILASRQGHVNVMTTLTKAGPNNKLWMAQLLNDADDEGNTALHQAVIENEKAAVEKLLEWGADPNRVNCHELSALHLCALNANSKLIPLLVRHGAFLEAKDPRGRSPLHIAAHYQKDEAVVSLLSAGADPNCYDKSNVTPFITACATGNVNIVSLMLQQGAQLNKKSVYGKTALHVAAESSHLDVLTLLLRASPQSLINEKDEFDQTPLHVVAKQQNVKLVEALIQNGCQANAIDVIGRIPLHLAASSSSYETVAALADYTKDINMETYELKSAFLMACENGNRQAIKALIDKGARIRDTDSHFRNTLMAAAIGGYTDIVEELIRRGIEVHAKDMERNTALHHACSRGHLSTVTALLQHGASVTDTNVHGKSPLDMAVDRSWSCIAELLMKHHTWKESMSVRDKFGRTAIDRMIRKTPNAVKILLDNCMKKSNHPPYDEEYMIEFDYQYLDPGPFDPVSKYGYYNGIVTMLELENEDLLSHPVCQSLLLIKWRKYGRFGLALSLFLNVVFIGLILGLLFSLPRPSGDILDANGCPLVRTNHSNETDIARPHFEEDYLYTLELLLYGMMGFILLKELIHLIVMSHLKFAVGAPQSFTYMKFINIMVLTTAIALMLHATLPWGLIPCVDQWRSVSYGMFIFTIHTIWLYQRIDSVGLYFSMFFEVFHSMVKLSVVMTFFLLLFSIPLTIFLNQDGFKDGDPFILTVLAMTIGELNFRDNFIKGDNAPYTYDLYVMFPIFCLIMPLSITNLMIGVAIGDISKVEKRAYLTRLKTQVNFLLETEIVAPPPLRRYLHVGQLVVKPNKTSGKNMFNKIFHRMIHRSVIEFINRDKQNHDHDFRAQIETQNAKLEEQGKTLSTVLEMLKSMTQSPERSNSRGPTSVMVSPQPTRGSMCSIKNLATEDASSRM